MSIRTTSLAEAALGARGTMRAEERRFLQQAQNERTPTEAMDGQGIVEADEDEWLMVGERIPRVLFGALPNSLRTHHLALLGLTPFPHPHVFGLHVTSDPEYWIYRLSEDYDYTLDDARVIEIEVLPGDRLAYDVQYMTDPDSGEKASSSVLLTTRRVLRLGTDFFVSDDEAMYVRMARERAQEPSEEDSPYAISQPPSCSRRHR
ncbi:MAG: hypothetical protein ABIE42_09260 [Candidatus Eisenbacteria bacterium]